MASLQAEIAPTEAGLDPTPLRQLQEEMRARTDAKGLPGYGLCVTRGGQAVHADYHGLRDLERGGKIDADTLFRQYSMSKAIVSVALMTFFDEGRFDLDDDVSRFLGEAWAPAKASKPEEGIRVSDSDGMVRGRPGEAQEDRVIGDGDTVFFRADPPGAHIDVDPVGDVRCRWDDPGVWQAMRVEMLGPGANSAPSAPGAKATEIRVALRTHTGRFLDFSEGSVVAKSSTPKVWRLVRAATSDEKSGLCAGAVVMLQHEEASVWLKVDDAEPDAGDQSIGKLCVTKDEGAATGFALEKQTWRTPSTVPAERPITFRNVLTHTTGLDYAGVDDKPRNALDGIVRVLVERCERGEVRTLAEWVAEMAKMPLGYQPGVEFVYGYSTDLAGRLCEVLGDAPLDQVLQERILGPLGMASTSFSASPEDARRRLAALYDFPEGSEASIRLVDDPLSSLWVPPLGPAPIMSAGGGVETLRGGLLSSVADYLRFCHMLLGGGQLDGVRVLRESTVKLMTEVNHLSLAVGDAGARVWDGRGWGLLGSINMPERRLLSRSDPNVGACGWGGWAATSFRVYPSSGIAYVLMTNCIDSGAEFEELILQRLGEAIRGHSAKARLRLLLWKHSHWLPSLAPALLGVAFAAVLVAPVMLRQYRGPQPFLRKWE